MSRMQHGPRNRERKKRKHTHTRTQYKGDNKGFENWRNDSKSTGEGNKLGREISEELMKKEKRRRREEKKKEFPFE